MKLRHNMLMALLLLAVLPVGARSRLPKSNKLTGSAFEAGVGAGWTTLQYTLTDGTNTGAAHFSVHAGYSYFFNRNIGIGVGVDFARYGASAYYGNKLLTWDGVQDSDGETYMHQTQLNHWRETQSLYAVSVPLVLQFAFPINRSLQFIGDVGVRYAHFVSTGYAASGNITHTGYYAPWRLTLQDMEPYGFYSTSDFRPSGSLNNRPFSINLVAKFGVVIPINKRVDLTAKAYLDYGLTRALDLEENAAALGFRNDHDGMSEMHSFMNDYSTILATDQLNGGRANVLAVGIEVGVRVSLSTKHKCNCLRGNQPSFRHKKHKRR